MVYSSQLNQEMCSYLWVIISIMYSNLEDNSSLCDSNFSVNREFYFILIVLINQIKDVNSQLSSWNKGETNWRQSWLFTSIKFTYKLSCWVLKNFDMRIQIFKMSMIQPRKSGHFMQSMRTSARIKLLPTSLSQLIWNTV